MELVVYGAVGPKESERELAYRLLELALQREYGLESLPEIRRAVKEFFRFAVQDWNRRNGTDWDWRQIQVTLNTNGITDDVETVQMIKESQGIVSEKTLLGKHPFVEDVNSEMVQLEKERGRKKHDDDGGIAENGAGEPGGRKNTGRF